MRCTAMPMSAACMLGPMLDMTQQSNRDMIRSITDGGWQRWLNGMAVCYGANTAVATGVNILQCFSVST